VICGYVNKQEQRSVEQRVKINNECKKVLPEMSFHVTLSQTQGDMDTVLLGQSHVKRKGDIANIDKRREHPKHE
jgi:hypothetical protein